MDHEAEINRLHRRQTRTKIVVLSVLGLVGLLTYLLINVSQQLASTENMDFRSRASEIYTQEGGEPVGQGIQGCNQECNNQVGPFCPSDLSCYDPDGDGNGVCRHPVGPGDPDCDPPRGYLCEKQFEQENSSCFKMPYFSSARDGGVCLGREFNFKCVQEGEPRNLPDNCTYNAGSGSVSCIIDYDCDSQFTDDMQCDAKDYEWAIEACGCRPSAGLGHSRTLPVITPGTQ